MNKKLALYSIFLVLGVTLNLYYYWGSIWTIWAKHYIKDQDIIISMTTTPHRIKQLEAPLECLARQNVAVRQIYISIPYVFKREQMTYSVPDWLDNYPNVTILRTQDYGPATKLLGALKNAQINPDTIIVAVDDDTCYPDNTILQLAVRAKRNPYKAIGISGAELDFDKNKSGGIIKIMRDHADVSILEGFAGVAYRAVFFDDEIYDVVNAPNCCYNSDDLYISFHLAKNHIKRESIYNRFIKVTNIKQQGFGFEKDALFRLNGSQATRYLECARYLKQKYPHVAFSIKPS